MEELAFAFREELREGGALGPVWKRETSKKLQIWKNIFLTGGDICGDGKMRNMRP